MSIIESSAILVASSVASGLSLVRRCSAAGRSPLVPIGGVTGLAVKFAVMLVLPNLFLLLAYGRMEGFRLAKPFVLGMLKR